MTAPQFADYARHVQTLMHAALAAADPATAVSRHLQRQNHTLLIQTKSAKSAKSAEESPALTFDLTNGRLFLISVGKAALPMLDAAVSVLGDGLFAGIAITKTIPPGCRPSHPAVQIYRGSHPVSTEKSVQATTAVHTLLRQTTANDLVLCLISGGASALLTRPRIPLPDWQALNRALLASGCTIKQFNTVRRQLDAAKGGGLSRWAAPARTVSLILSDVVGSPLEYIGSGPTVPGDDTLADALAVLEQFAVDGGQWTVGSGQWAVDSGQFTVGSGQVAVSDFPPPVNIIVGDVGTAAEAALAKAEELGFTGQLLTTHLEGEAREAGLIAAAIAKDTPPGRCLILGGETTVTLRGDGLGGRNLETALAAAIALERWPARVIASFATDGEDGPTDAAGAVVTGKTVGADGRLKAAAALQNNDSYTFFHNLETTLLQPGPTGTNVNDLILILTYDHASRIIHNS
jgi:hydroxypyruvate reductase